MKKAVPVRDIKVGAVYRHYKGSVFLVVGLCRIESNLKTGVLYKAVHHNADDVTWMMPLENFKQNVLESGRLVPRFTIVLQVS
jgi:hypothetical protein